MSAGETFGTSLVLIATFALGWLLGSHGGAPAGVQPGWAVVAALVPIIFGFSAFARFQRKGKAGPVRTVRQTADDEVGCLPRHDAQTGLPNRTAFLERLRRALDGTRQDDRMVAVLRLEIRELAAINEAHGHLAGDLLVRHTGARLLALLRECDSIARVGAGGFAVLQSNVAGPEAAIGLTDRLLAAVAEPFDLFGKIVRVRACIGIAIHPVDGEDPDDLLRRAGLAAERARTADRSSAFFGTAIDEEVRLRKGLERDLHFALERRQLELHFQPQIDLASRRIIGVEVLSRWNHPEHGRVPPDRFIPLAEDCGLILAIGEWVLEEACRQVRSWREAGMPPIRISVNLSPVQLHQADLAERVVGILARNGIEPTDLELEITERVLIEDTPSVLHTLEALRGLGIRLSVDDFGTGNASLGYLKRFAFDEIKVDRSFIVSIGSTPSSAAILRAALALGRSLGSDVVAEGVESEEQLAMLLAERCPLAQGFLFSPPLSATEIERLLRAAAESEATKAGPASTSAA